ncbi:DUF1800 family protein [Massilia sp. LjRoot122]|uniref:DUF1800 family protein n=1 Tax=Massilia sp. LjRoot122 TaxID=3342257 RepID=UPI003ECF80BB
MGILIDLFRRAALALLVLGVAAAPQAHARTPMDERLALHLLNRLAYGPAPGDVERVRAMGVDAYVDSQLAPPPLPPRLEARLRELADPGTPAAEASLLRAIASPHQLEEVLTAFWLAHFMEGQAGDAEAGAGAALRPHVLGHYAALRAAIRPYLLARGRPYAGGSGRDAMGALIRHFVSAPSAGLYRSLERVWDKTGGDQRAVLRALLTSREFLAPAQWNSKRKDDFRFVVSAVRASGVAVENVAPLAEFLRAPMAPGERSAFVEQLAGGRLALAQAPPQAHRHASSAPPMRAAVEGAPPQGTVAQPGPVLMEAPTPSAAAMAAAARSQPPDADRLRQLLRSEDFQRY